MTVRVVIRRVVIDVVDPLDRRRLVDALVVALGDGLRDVEWPVEGWRRDRVDGGIVVPGADGASAGYGEAIAGAVGRAVAERGERR